MAIRPIPGASREAPPVARARRLGRQGRWPEAERLLAGRLASHPGDTAALDLLADLYLATGHPAQAAEVLALLARRRDPDAHLWYRLAIALQRGYRYADAIPAFHRVTQAAPANPHGWTGLAWCLAATGAPDVAAIAAARAEALAPGDPRVAHTVAACRLAVGALEDAEARYQRLRAADPSDETAAWGLAQVAFRRGDFATAWPLAECRHREMRQRGTFRALPAPTWRGEDLAGGTLLVVHEQGAGDLLQFARFLTPAAARGARLVVEAPAALRDLVAGIPGVAAVVAPGSPVPEARAALHLMSLPFALGTGDALLGDAVPYLAPRWACPAAIAEALPTPASDDPDRPRRIGIAWAGAAGHANDHLRSMPIEALAPLLAQDGIRWVSLQAGERAADLARLPSTLRDRVTDASAWLTSYEATAHVIARLDLVVSVDTSVAHLAGAMDRRTWLFLPREADWRWTGAGTTTGWYPRMRLFRQPAPHDWASVVREAAAVLAGPVTP